MNSWVVHKINTWLAWNLDWTLDLLLPVVTLRSLWSHRALLVSIALDVRVQAHATSLSGEASQLLLELLLALRQVEARHLHLLHVVWVNIFSLVIEGWRSHNLLW